MSLSSSKNVYTWIISTKLASKQHEIEEEASQHVAVHHLRNQRKALPAAGGPRAASGIEPRAAFPESLPYETIHPAMPIQSRLARLLHAQRARTIPMDGEHHVGNPDGRSHRKLLLPGQAVGRDQDPSSTERPSSAGKHERRRLASLARGNPQRDVRSGQQNAGRGQRESLSAAQSALRFSWRAPARDCGKPPRYSGTVSILRVFFCVHFIRFGGLEQTLRRWGRAEVLCDFFAHLMRAAVQHRELDAILSTSGPRWHPRRP